LCIGNKLFAYLTQTVATHNILYYGMGHNSMKMWQKFLPHKMLLNHWTLAIVVAVVLILLLVLHLRPEI